MLRSSQPYVIAGNNFTKVHSKGKLTGKNLSFQFLEKQ